MEVATILTILVLNILLPTADVFSDINLAVKLYSGHYPEMATLWPGAAPASFYSDQTELTAPAPKIRNYFGLVPSS